MPCILCAIHILFHNKRTGPDPADSFTIPALFQYGFPAINRPSCQKVTFSGAAVKEENTASASAR